MKTKLILLCLMFTLAITSCSDDKVESIKTCGVITSMSTETDANNVNHYYIEVRKIDKGIPTNSYDQYEVTQSEYDRVFPTYMNNNSNNMETDDCIVTLKLIISRTTN
jgi:hypothetical protein